MPRRRESGVTEGLWSMLVTQTRDVVIILSAFGVLTALGIFVVAHYNSAKDAATILGVLIPAISTRPSPGRSCGAKRLAPELAGRAGENDARRRRAVASCDRRPTCPASVTKSVGTSLPTGQS